MRKIIAFICLSLLPVQALAQMAVGGQYKASPPTLSDGQQQSLLLDSTGALITTGGSGGGGTYTGPIAAQLPATLGAKTGALSLSVVPNTDTAFPVSAASLPLPAGAATSAKQDTLTTALGTPFQAGGSIGNTTFAATQSGTWNLTNISGTVSLPTGAATAAKQPALGTAGSASTDVITIQGITSGTPVITGGAVASGATDSGNPTKVAGKYNSTLPTFTDGQRGDLQIGARGSLHAELWGTDSTSAVSASTNAADAQGTSVVGLNVNARCYIFNATTTDRCRSAANAANTTGTGIAAVGDMGQCDDTSPTAITENSFGNLRINCTTHALITQPYETGANAWSYAAASGGISNTTTAVTIQAADATRRICVIGLQLSAPTLGAATEVALRDGAGGTVLWRGYMSTAGGNQSLSAGTPICGTANTLMEIVTLTATVTGAVYVNAQGFLRL